MRNHPLRGAIFEKLQKTYNRSGLIIGDNICQSRSGYFIYGYSSIYNLYEKLTDDGNFNVSNKTAEKGQIP